jgi:biotin carboxylase
MAATKGLYAQAFLREIKRQGHRLLVLTQAEALGYDWPRDIIDELFAVVNIFDPKLVRDTVSYVARHHAIDRVVALGEYDIEIGAALREHLQLAGIGVTTARNFRDKLAMRRVASEAGLRVPEFTPLFPHAAVGAFMAEVPGPWVLKPRTEASSNGIKVIHHPDELWRELDRLGDEQSNFLLERFTPGDVYHVDGVVSEGKVLMARVHRYGMPILQLHRQGGVYTTRALKRGDAAEKELQAFNAEVVSALGLPFGVTHIEYIRSQTDGKLYFLEASARVGAGMIEDMVEAETGLNLWVEWARLEIAQAHATAYRLPTVQKAYAGVAACMAPYEHPDLRHYAQPGVKPLEAKPYHASVLVEGADAAEVEAKLEGMAKRLAQDFMVHVPGH